MKRVPQITCVGEALVDFVSTKNGVTLSNAPGFVKCAGGASANVAVGLAKLGVRSAYVGRVGNDSFGNFLRDELARKGVDISGVKLDRERKTRLAFVSLTTSGDRDFEFHEQHPAGERLIRSDIDLAKLKASRVVHIGSFLLLNEPARSTAFALAKEIRRHGSMISFDPNLRLSLWRSRHEARSINVQMIKHTSILRLNQEEAYFLTGKRNIRSAVKHLRALGPSVVVVTLDKEGCYACTEQGSVFVKGFRVRAIDTTGCGDGFLAGLLAGLVKSSRTLEGISMESLYLSCRYANAVGALTAKKRGGISAMPGSAEVKQFLSTR